jgi:hypothetical protein
MQSYDSLKETHEFFNLRNNEDKNFNLNKKRKVSNLKNGKCGRCKKVKII